MCFSNGSEPPASTDTFIFSCCLVFMRNDLCSEDLTHQATTPPPYLSHQFTTFSYFFLHSLLLCILLFPSYLSPLLLCILLFPSYLSPPSPYSPVPFLSSPLLLCILLSPSYLLTGHLGEPVLLPVWVPLPCVHHPDHCLL